MMRDRAREGRALSPPLPPLETARNRHRVSRVCRAAASRSERCRMCARWRCASSRHGSPSHSISDYHSSELWQAAGRWNSRPEGSEGSGPGSLRTACWWPMDDTENSAGGRPDHVTLANGRARTSRMNLEGARPCERSEIDPLGGSHRSTWRGIRWTRTRAIPEFSATGELTGGQDTSAVNMLTKIWHRLRGHSPRRAICPQISLADAAELGVMAAEQHRPSLR
jgi:hypothetical protein